MIIRKEQIQKILKVKILGDISALSSGMQKSIRKCMERTKIIQVLPSI